jgi:HSP20 family protein
MSLTRRDPNQYDPFYNVNRMFDQMRTFMNTALVPFEGQVWPEFDTNTLAVDMTSDEKNVIIRTGVPGFKEDEVNIDVQGKILTITAESKSEHEDKKENWHIRELRYGKFARSITLPDEVIADHAEASLENGVLTLTLPKQKPSLAKKIAVKARELLPAGHNGHKS